MYLDGDISWKEYKQYLMKRRTISPDEKFKERFWAKVDIKGADECWNWKGAKCSGGYGSFWVTDNSINPHKVIGSHKVAYELIHGKIHEGLSVLHRCDNPACCNPNHLFLGTQECNVRDMENKHRGSHPKGEHHGLSKLTESQVKEIRSLYRTNKYSQRDIANKFNVSQYTIMSIVNGVTWK